MNSPLETTHQAQFEQLLREGSRAYLSTPVGQEHRLAYARLRAAARQNYAAIATLDAQGAAITDAVLWKLLPYTDSAQHRVQGAWVHLAPAISGDLRAWYEAAGWTQPQEWPEVARAIWRLVQRATQQPGELAAVCADFASLPYAKGFQMGMLTPILNALAPEHFLLLHNKNRAALNYFTGSSFSPTLTDYAAANTALQSFITEQPTLQEAAREHDLPPGDLYDLFCHWLVTLHRFRFRPLRYWQLGMGDEPGLWEEWQAGSYVALSWDALGDLDSIGRREFEQRRDSLLAQYPAWTKAGANQVWRLARQLAEDDLILVTAPDGTLLGQGTVTGPYYYAPEVALGHRRPVVWGDVTPRQAALPKRQGLAETDRTLYETAQQAAPLPAHDYDPPVSAPAPLRDQATAYAATPAARQPAHTLAQVAAATGLDEDVLAAWTRTIIRKGQAILYGPPGTGKTYVAQQLARHLAAGGDGFVELVQFHPAYSYEDFIQGIRPQVRQGGLSYELRAGRFVAFCRQAAARTGPCVLLVDEINRANLAQVFGELLYLLEYRETPLVLAGDDHPFAVPANVYLIGTMNTADRSLALVDYALRRRFAFLPLYPDFAMLRRYHQRHATGFPIAPLIALLEMINNAIGDPNLALGITYFLRPDLAAQIGDIWQLEIEPYLVELFFDQPEQVQPYRWVAVRGALGL